MAHRNARLTEFGRLLLVQPITELGWPRPRRLRAWGVAGHRRQVAWPLPRRGRAGLADRLRDPPLPARAGSWSGASGAGGSASPSPGPHRLGYHLAMPRSTVYGVLRRHGMSRLSHTDRASGVVVRYQREHPGELVHLDVKNLGRIPDGGGHRIHGRAKGTRGRGIGYDYLHSASMTAPELRSASSWPTRRPPPRPASWSSGQLLRRPWRDHPAGADRQRQGLCRVGAVRRDRRQVGIRLKRTRLPAPAQRQGGAVQPNPAR
jgi:hypothetical protein